MNIFVLDLDPKKCAQYHCDKHIVKMPAEQAQIMCTVLHELGYDVPYRPTHAHHLCTIWVKQSLSNYMWLRELLFESHKEFQYRYNEAHKSGLVIEQLPTPTNLPDIGLTPFAQAIPEILRDKDPVVAYRDYYRFVKTDLLKYKRREQPYWV